MFNLNHEESITSIVMNHPAALLRKASVSRPGGRSHKQFSPLKKQVTVIRKSKPGQDNQVFFNE